MIDSDNLTRQDVEALIKARFPNPNFPKFGRLYRTNKYWTLERYATDFPSMGLGRTKSEIIDQLDATTFIRANTVKGREQIEELKRGGWVVVCVKSTFIQLEKSRQLRQAERMGA